MALLDVGEQEQRPLLTPILVSPSFPLTSDHVRKLQGGDYTRLHSEEIARCDAGDTTAKANAMYLATSGHAQASPVVGITVLPSE